MKLAPAIYLLVLLSIFCALTMTRALPGILVVEEIVDDHTHDGESGECFMWPTPTRIICIHVEDIGLRLFFQE